MKPKFVFVSHITYTLYLKFATGAGASLEGSNRESVVQREDVHNRSGTTLSGPLGAISERRES